MNFRDQQDRTLKGFLETVDKDMRAGHIRPDEISDEYLNDFLLRYTRDAKYADELMKYYEGLRGRDDGR